MIQRFCVTNEILVDIFQNVFQPITLPEILKGAGHVSVILLKREMGSYLKMIN